MAGRNGQELLSSWTRPELLLRFRMRARARDGGDLAALARRLASPDKRAPAAAPTRAGAGGRTPVQMMDGEHPAPTATANPQGAPPATSPRPSAEVVDRKYYEVVAPQSFAERLMIRARDRIYDDFMRMCRPGPEDTVLDVGVSDVLGDAANVLERRYPWPDRITAAGLGAAEEFQAAFPSVTYRQIEPNQPLPFPDETFSIATCNAVLEHVGSEENQRRFLSELMRVGKRVFLTVPHRYFPVEHHSAIPLLHWTDSGFALASRLLGKQKWAQAENLILMSRGRLRAVCPPGAHVEVGTTGLKLGPCSANLYLYAGERREG